VAAAAVASGIGVARSYGGRSPAPPEKKPAAAPVDPAAIAAAAPFACRMAGGITPLVPHALPGAGIDVVQAGSLFGVGIATAPREGLALLIDPAHVTADHATKIMTTEPVRHVVPLPSAGGFLDVAADSSSARTIFDPEDASSFVLAFDGAHITRSVRGGDGAILWPALGNPESFRAVPIRGGRALALAWRRGHQIELGVLSGDDARTPEGPLDRIDAGRDAGPLSIAAVGDDVAIAWADAGGALRFARWPTDRRPDAPRVLERPDGGLGGAMTAPALAAFGTSLVLAWVEGNAGRRQVRAQPITVDGAALAAPIVVSEGATAPASPAAVFDADGRGLVFYFARAAVDAHGLFVAPVICATGS
jgi:hypothetical protein